MAHAIPHRERRAVEGPLAVASEDLPLRLLHGADDELARRQLLLERCDVGHELVDAGAEVDEVKVVARQNGQRTNGPHALEAMQHDAVANERRQQHDLQHHLDRDVEDDFLELRHDEGDQPEEQELFLVLDGEEHHPERAEEHVERHEHRHGDFLPLRDQVGVVELRIAPEEGAADNGHVVADADHCNGPAALHERIGVRLRAAEA
mmetsp:Transcript_37968/g.119108  ORF Transcript_37968/g.119108 Transcript_37968/m.119108 type:complete len:206 (-) Transcript_37968:5863-6480(-)